MTPAEVRQLQGADRKLRRSLALDALRGAAVLAMVVDHLALMLGWTSLRETVGRVAVPLFFVLAGHLSRRLSWRLLLVFAVGVLLPWLAPWVDSPNVLVWYVLGALVLAGARRVRLPLVLVLVVCLTALANPLLFRLASGVDLGSSYPPAALLALMAVGALLPRSQLLLFARLPVPLRQALALLGRYPLTVYVGHVLALTVLFG